MATFEAKHPKATEDRGVLPSSHEFPAEHRDHIRTTNTIDSACSTSWLRDDRTKGSGIRVSCPTMVYRLMEPASSEWRTLNGWTQLTEVFGGTAFLDGVEKQPTAREYPVYDF